MRVGRSIVAAMANHAALTTGVHGVGSDYLAKTGQSDGSLSDSEIPDAIARDAEVTSDLGDHAALATVHQDAPTLISTHAALATVHQDAPALILTHKGDAAAHHAAHAISAAGDVLLVGADTEVTSDWPSWTKVKEIAAGLQGGTYRIKFDIKTINATYPMHGRIYKDGTPVGTDQSTNSLSYVTQSEDIAGWAAGDAIELWVQLDAVAGYVENFRIYALSGADPAVVSD